MIEIFVSDKHDYRKQVKNIFNKLPSNLIKNTFFLEDTLKNGQPSDYWSFKYAYPSIIYFLCNNNEIPDLIQYAKQSFIVNGGYYELRLNKREMFERLTKLHLSISFPKFIPTYTNLTNEEYPIYVKADNHQGIVFKAFNKEMIQGFEKAVNIQDYYFEEDVEKDSTREIKVFYIKGMAIAADSDVQAFEECKQYNSKLLDDMDTLAKKFKLDVYSVDIIFDKNKQYIIDINPSPAFYSSKIATAAFAQFLSNKL